MTTAPPAIPTRPAGRVPVWVWAALALLLVSARLWRFEAVGEGLDEGYDVRGTRALIEGRFGSFAQDDYLAHVCPVSEALAVPFVLVLGDRPLAFRLPSLLASLALGLLLAREAKRRFGPWPAAFVLAAFALEYRSVYYAQAEHYPAVEALAAWGFVAFGVRSARTGRGGDAALAALCGLVALHAHLLAALVLGPVAAFSALRALRRGAEGGAPPRALGGAMLALLAWTVGAFVVYRGFAAGAFFEALPLGASLARGARTMGRALAGLGAPALLLGLPGAVLLARRRAFEDHVVAIAALGALAFAAALSARVLFAPRYLLVAQPFLLLSAGATVEALLPAWSGARRGAGAAFVVVTLAASGVLTGWYLATGGGRDAEAPLLAALRAEAKPGDGVLYDVPQEDPFGRRPTNLRAVSRRHVLDPDGARHLDAERVRWVLRHSAWEVQPVWTDSVRVRLEPVESVTPRALFQEPWTLTLYRLHRP